MSGTVPFGGAQTGATTDGVTAIPVIWFDGTSSRRHQARLHSNGDDVWLVTNDATGNADANPAHIRKAPYAWARESATRLIR